MIDSDILTAKQVAELFAVAPATVKSWARKGWLSAYTTPGGHRRFLGKDIREFAATRGVEEYVKQFSARKGVIEPSHSLNENKVSVGADDDQSRRILIVDDDQNLCRYLVEFLRHQCGNNCTVESAHSGFEVGVKVCQFQPDTIVLDLKMPGMDGFDVCHILKGDEKTKRIQIIAMTAYYDSANIQRVLDLGATSCLQKPIDEQELIQVLNIPTRGIEGEAGLVNLEPTLAECSSDGQKIDQTIPKTPASSVLDTYDNFTKVLSLIAAMADESLALDSQYDTLSLSVSTVSPDKLVQLQEAYEIQLAVDGLALKNMIRQFSINSSDFDLRDNIELLTHRLKGAGNTFGYNLVTTVAAKAYTILKTSDTLSEKDLRNLMMHYDALLLVAEKKMKGNGGVAGHAVLGALSQCLL